MREIKSIDPAPHPTVRPTFLVDWMINKFCNLDCSYCGSYSHDNFSPHPRYQEVLDTIDFIYEYVDLYMQYKRKWQKGLVLNVYGGEGMLHPNIVDILKEVRVRHDAYKDKWPLTVLITTNAVIGPNTFARVMDYVDSWTVSFHSEALPKQREMSLNNAKMLHDAGKDVKCVIMLHPEKEYWDICMAAVEFCKQNNIPYLDKALDTTGPGEEFQTDLRYSDQQMQHIKSKWVDGSVGDGKRLLETSVDTSAGIESRSQGRICCGGRSICINGDFKNRVNAVPLDGFTGWTCSVNWYFLHINSTTGEIYNNKDCRTSLRNLIEPVGYIKDAKGIIHQHRHWLETKTMPVITCINKSCNCGMCAPKAKDRETFDQLMKTHWTEDRCQLDTYTLPTTLPSQEKS